MLTAKSLEVPEQQHRIEAFSLSSRYISESKDVRLDASYYNPRVAQAIAILRRSGLPLKTLGDHDVTQRIFIPPRFKRVYVSQEHGVPFLQGTHIVHFQPADLKYLSRVAQKKLEKWIIKEGWVLVTCSGTIGRVGIVPKSWDGWAASQHLLRIIPQPDGVCQAGYLYAYLSSPLGQAQLTAQIYGAVVDELTEAQTRSVLVPIPKTPQQHEMVQKINALAMESMLKREEAVGLAEDAVRGIGMFIQPK